MFMAGANSIFTGDRLLTTSNPEFDADKVMMKSGVSSFVLRYSASLSCCALVFFFVVFSFHRAQLLAIFWRGRDRSHPPISSQTNVSACPC